MKNELTLNRRQFLSATAVTAMASVVPRHVLGGPRHVPPSEKINLAYIGCGTQGFRQIIPVLESPDFRVVSVCDPNRKSDDYPDYGGDELNNKVRKFLNDPNWAKGARGALCGREVGKEIVDRYYAAHAGSAGKADPCRAYVDYRELLVKEKDLDAVYIITPDHLHGCIAVRAMRASM
jgi:predicted dehydrogenase